MLLVELIPRFLTDCRHNLRNYPKQHKHALPTLQRTIGIEEFNRKIDSSILSVIDVNILSLFCHSLATYWPLYKQ